jgi:hypothetical protein
MKKSFWLSRTVGGVLAGVVMAGAGAGVAIAGASGTSDQYTRGAKPYAGVQPHDVTVGTQTFPSSVTTTIANTTVTNTSTVTTPYYVVVPTVPASTTAALQAAVAALTANAATINTLLKPQMRNLLEGTGNYLKTPTLAKAKKISFKFTSPGAGKLAVSWKVGLPGGKGVFYIKYSGTLRKSGDITVNLPTTAAGRSLLARATKGANVVSLVTFTSTSGTSVKVSRSYKLKG